MDVFINAEAEGMQWGSPACSDDAKLCQFFFGKVKSKLGYEMHQKNLS